MIHRKFVLLLLTTLLISANAFAAEADSVKTSFTQYWSAYTAGNYLGAAQKVHPEDLAGVQKEILPVFIQWSEASDPQLKQIAAAFFDGVPDAKRKTLSGAEALAQMMKFIGLANPQIMEAVKTSRMEIGAVNFDPKSPGDAVINYSLAIAGAPQPAAASERLSKVDGAWFIRSKESAAEIAAKFKASVKK